MKMYTLYLDYLRTGICLAMLVYASYRDLKTREIHDLVWIIFAAIGLTMDGYEIIMGTLAIQQLAIAVGFMIVIGALLSFLKLFGGADILAFITLVAIQPKSPVFLTLNWGWHPIFYPLTIITNTAFAGLVAPLIILSFNIKSILGGVNVFQGHKISLARRLGLLFTALNTSLKEVRGPPFQYPLVNPTSGEVALRPNIWDDTEAEKVFTELKHRGVDRTWVSWTLPYVVVMTIGYAITVVFGDLLLWAFILLS